MALDEAGMHRAGLAFLYRIVPVLVATVLYGIYVAILSVATRGLWHRGLRNPYNALILGVLYLVFCLSSALWALEVAQLIGLVDLLLSPGTLTTDALFNRFYDLIARETRVTGILFQSQMVAGDILVIWRASAIWHDQRIVVLLPLFWWTLMIGNMLAHASRCQSGVSTTNYSKLCKVTDVAAPVLSITTNISVMILVLWKGWQLREALMNEYQRRRENKIFTLFVLMVESGTLYAIMLVTDLLVTSLVTGGNETLGRMVDCVSGYAAVQLVGIYPTLLIVVLGESLWNKPTDSSQGPVISTVRFASSNKTHGNTTSSTINAEQRHGRVVDVSLISDTHPQPDGLQDGSSSKGEKVQGAALEYVLKPSLVTP
ncbi:hypothetical protein BD310DRAFT_942687 [Dichomitus squalens]|uniref:Uncharacterized protein n=1 Tax=Dichomitus squalens TaxID=114155 RepID=A0A4Q9P987_9APHY|nr:hypothetical protein BD310DRAFT_942687 [Dichomitus squalens]